MQNISDETEQQDESQKNELEEIDVDTDDDASGAVYEGNKFVSEGIEQLKLTLPVCTTFLLRKSVDVVGVIFVGHLYPEKLSSAGLATVTANVTGFSMLIGLAGALTTLCTQAYGAKDMVTLQIVLQQAVVILATFICVPMTIVWCLSNYILESLGQNSTISTDAGLYLRFLIPSLWVFTCSVCIQNWLHSQAKTQGIAWMSLLVAIMHPIWCYFFMSHLKLGFHGAAIAVSVSKTLELVLYLIYVRFGTTVLADTQFAFSSKCLENWWPYLRLGLPNVLMMMEWWASEIIIFMSGLLSEPELQVSAMTIYQNTLSIAFMIPSGINVAGATRVGIALGANDPEGARVASVVGPASAFGASFLLGSALMCMQRRWATVFTEDTEVVTSVCAILPIIFFYVVGDGTQSALTGILKGMGKQRVGGPIVIFSYYVVGLPLSAYLAFGLRWGIQGLCIGTTAGTWTHMALYAVVVARTDWVDEARVVHMRSKLQAAMRARGSGGVGPGPPVSGSGPPSPIILNSVSARRYRELQQQQSNLLSDFDQDDDWWDDLSHSLGFDATSSSTSGRGESGDTIRDGARNPSARAGGNGSGRRSGGRGGGEEGTRTGGPLVASASGLLGGPSGVLAVIREWLGMNARQSEYELVQTYTNTFSALAADDGDDSGDEGEITFG